MTTLAPLPASPGSPLEPVAVYEASKRGIPRLGPYVRGVFERRPFIWHLVRTDMKAENYNTALGQLWLILNPVLLAAVFILGRSVIRPMGSPGERDYLISHLIMGIFYFQYVSDGIGRGSKSVVSNQRLILNTSFPRAIFPLSSTVRALFDFLPLLVVLFFARLLLGQPFTWSQVVFVPVIVALLTVFNLGLTMGASAITVFFRDFGNVISFGTRLWLWSTPILYTTSEIPDGVRPYLEMNPLYPFYAALEQIYQGKIPSGGYLLWAAAWTIPIFVVGAVIFMTRERDFAARF